MKRTKAGTAEKKTNRRKLEFYCISQNHLFETEDPQETLPQLCPPSPKIPEDKLVYTSGSWPCAHARTFNKQSGVWFLPTVSVYPLPAASARPLSHVGDVRQLLPLGQGGHHVLQLGADGGVVVLALFGQPVEAVPQGAVWSCLGGRCLLGRREGGRGGLVWRCACWCDEVGVLCELEVSLGVTLRH